LEEGCALKKILLIEDCPQIISANAKILVNAGYDVRCTLTLEDAYDMLDILSLDLIVLDVIFQDGNGLDFLPKVRSSPNAEVPVLILSGLSTTQDIVRGLNAGADDYLIKPYQFDEFLARVEALIRRFVRIPSIIKKGRLSINSTTGIAMVDGKDLLLTEKESILLLIFAQNEARFIQARDLYQRVWGVPMGINSTALRSAVKRLRAKIEGCGWVIGWSRGEGYIFERE